MTHFLADDGETIHLKISGEGRPLVMLHGWTSSHQEWFPFASQLSQQYKLYRWDARGHGGHRLTQAQMPTVARMARDLHNLLTHYDLHDAVVAGHSMGALTLWQYLRDFGPDRLAGVCIIDQSPKLLTDSDWPHGIYGDFGEQAATQLLSSLQTDFAEGVLQLTALGLNQRARQMYQANALGWTRSREALRQQNPEPLIACWQSLTQADYRDVLHTLHLPTLLIYGGESNFYHTDTAHYVARQIPNALLHIYEGTDHSPHQWQRERFVRELSSFIDDLP